MLFDFSQGFKEGNRSVFVDTNTNYYLSKAQGREPGADEVLPPELLEQLNKVHRAAAAGRRPVLTAIVLRPVVRFIYFPRTTFLFLGNFGDPDQRIEKVMRSYELAEDVGWDRVSGTIHLHGVLPARCFEEPVRFRGRPPRRRRAA